MILVDTSTEDDICIGTELIKAGHADGRADSALRVSPFSSQGPPSELRSVIAIIESLPTRKPENESSDSDEDDTPSEISCSVSEISCSASEVVGRTPRRLPEWECPEEQSNHLEFSSWQNFDARNGDIEAACDRLSEYPIDSFDKNLSINASISASSFASRFDRWKCAKLDSRNILSQKMSNTHLKTDINSNNTDVPPRTSRNVEKNHSVATTPSIISKLLRSKFRDKPKIPLDDSECLNVSSERVNEIMPPIPINNKTDQDVDSNSSLSSARLARLNALHSQLAKNPPESKACTIIEEYNCSESESNISFSSQLLRHKLEISKRFSKRILDIDK